MLRLIISWDNRVRTVPVPAAPATLGADAENDIVVACRGVSRRHALVTRNDDSILLEDLGSKNGLRVHGRRVDRVELSPGDDAVQLGRALLHLERIATSDAELAIRVDNRSSSHGRLGSTETRDAADGGAMLWVRDAELAGGALHGARRREFLRRAREIAAANTILHCHVLRSGGLAVDEIDGTPPDEDPPVPEGPPLRAIVRKQWIVIPLANRSFVAIHMETLAHDASRREFLEFVALKLFTGDVHSDDAVSFEIEELVFPAGYVRGDSRGMRALHDQIRAAARSDVHVLLRGENGTGKELVAQTLHASSRAGRGPFRAINCAAIPANLLEAELFGVRRRVATGVDPRPGLFVDATHGTVFLDEIGDLPLDLQPKLLRVLQEHEVLPLGTSLPVKVDARVIASTNRDLEAMIAEGTFRRDLYYRLRVLEIKVPPLRDHRDDIPQLVTELLPRIAKQHRKRIRGVSRKAIAHLMAHDWPGNVRELENALAQAIAQCPNGGALETTHFPELGAAPLTHSASLQSRLEATERETLLDALKRANGNKSAAARLLGITRAGLYLKLKRFRVE